MAKFAVRFLILSMVTTSLLIAPAVTGADAATTSGKHMKKRTKIVHQRPKAADPYASPFSSNKYDEDFDRKNAGAGGGY